MLGPATNKEEQPMLEIWDLWMPSVGATGLSFARSRVDDQAAGSRLLVHAAPPELEVVVHDQDGNVIAQGAVGWSGVSPAR
jgi:hypothetical protein